MTTYGHFSIYSIHFWDPALNRVISKMCYNEPCYKEVEVYLQTVETSHTAASDLGLQCLPITLLGVSRLQWVNGPDQPANLYILTTRALVYIHQ